MKRLYSASAVENYLEKNNLFIDDIIEGCLLDTYILYHADNCIEVFEAIATGAWSSAYARHIYRKGLPERFTKALEEQARQLAYDEMRCNGTFDLIEQAI